MHAVCGLSAASTTRTCESQAGVRRIVNKMQAKTTFASVSLCMLRGEGVLLG